MAYFAQAGSGQSHSQGGSHNGGATDQPAQVSQNSHLHPQAQPQGGPRLTVQPQVTVRAKPIAQPTGAQSGAQQSQPHASLRAEPPVSSSSPFPVEGPDLYANYQPRSEEPHVAANAAAPLGGTPEPAAQPELQQRPLQDYVSDDYGVPGIGTQSFAPAEPAAAGYAAQSFQDSYYGGQETAGQENADQGYGVDYGYGAAAQPNYGYDQEQVEDYGYDDQSYAVAAEGRGGLARVASLLGAAASLALVIGIGTWGYNLVMRDVSGVPVVRAVEGPMRTQPENPGGSQADHQGLAVNSVAANGTAAAPADRLTLAPQPIELSEDDQPMSRLTTPEADVPPQPVNQPAAQAEAQISEASVAAARAGDINALVAELTDGVAPIEATPPVAAAPAIVQPEPLQPVEIAAIGAAVAPSSALLNAPGVKVSLRPHVRPARFSPSAAQPVTTGTRATLEVDPSTLPAGTRLAQLGAYESAAVARAEWDRIYSRFEDYLEGKSRVIQRAESGGRTFYRLRAMGFDGLSDARRFCSALVASNADCIPVTTR